MLQDILASMHEVPTPLNTGFFSDQTVAAIQGDIIGNVKKQLGTTITDQDRNQLIIVMKFVYDLRPAFDTSDVVQQIALLRKQTSDMATGLCVTGIKQYLTYMQQASTLPEPLPQPVLTSVVGTKLYNAQGQLPPENQRAVAW